jgi:hypothetical protein
MRSAAVRHDAFVETLVSTHGGTLVRPWGEGDSRFAVFSRASSCNAERLPLEAEHVQVISADLVGTRDQIVQLVAAGGDAPAAERVTMARCQPDDEIGGAFHWRKHRLVRAAASEPPGRELRCIGGWHECGGNGGVGLLLLLERRLRRRKDSGGNDENG